ncbi:MAG: hypothetical protein ABIK62_00820 [candidate division WOR-3 bacterium]
MRTLVLGVDSLERWVNGCLVGVVLLLGSAAGQWVTSGVDTLTQTIAGKSLAMQALAVDSTGTLHAVWTERPRAGPGKLLYAYKRPGAAWSEPELVADSANNSPVIAVEPGSGIAHIAYVSPIEASGELYYATNRSGTWERERLTENSSYDWTPSIALHNGRVFLAWVIQDSTGAYHIACANNLSGRWKQQVLTGSELGSFGLGAAPFLAVGPDGASHISYRGGEYPEYHIHHAENAFPGDTNWRYQVLTTANRYDYVSGIAAGGSGELFLVASGNDGWGMQYRTCYLQRPAGDSIWEPYQLMTADASALLQGFFQHGGITHVSWEWINGNVSAENVWHCSNTSGRWYNSTIIADGKTSHGAIVIDPAGCAHCLVLNGTGIDSQQVLCVHSEPFVGVSELNRQRTACVPPLICQGILWLETDVRAVLLEQSGRKVMPLHPGRNDASRLASGVYFVVGLHRHQEGQRALNRVVLVR